MSCLFSRGRFRRCGFHHQDFGDSFFVKVRDGADTGIAVPLVEPLRAVIEIRHCQKHLRRLTKAVFLEMAQEPAADAEVAELRLYRKEPKIRKSAEHAPRCGPVKPLQGPIAVDTHEQFLLVNTGQDQVPRESGVGEIPFPDA